MALRTVIYDNNDTHTYSVRLVEFGAKNALQNNEIRAHAIRRVGDFVDY